MKIEKLTDKYVDYVSNTIQNRWNISKVEALEEINRWMSGNDNSVCLVGIVNKEPIATAVFDIVNDVDSSISPWNRQLWVEPEYRGKEYGYELTKARFLLAKECGYKEVYLSTLKAMDYHLKYGWKTVREVTIDNETHTIMKFDLNNFLFQVVCNYTPTDYDEKLFNFHKADMPKKEETYTVEKLFFHKDEYKIRDSCWALHLKELNHGTLIGYRAKDFKPKYVNLKLKQDGK